MQSSLNRFGVIIFLITGVAFSCLAQNLNLELDIRGRPFQANVAVMPSTGAESVPWEFEEQFNAFISNTVRETPGVGKVFTPMQIARYKFGARSTPWMRRYLESRHYMIRSYVEGGVIVKNSRGNEVLRFLSFQVSIINIATSQVEKVIRIQCDSKRFFEHSKKLKASKYPGMDLYKFSMVEHGRELLKKQLARFFYNIEPVEEWSLEGKDKGFITKWRGAANKDLQKLVDVVALRGTINTPIGPVYDFINLGSARYFPEKAALGKPYYRFISGRARAEKALGLGMKIYIFPDHTLL